MSTPRFSLAKALPTNPYAAWKGFAIGSLFTLLISCVCSPLQAEQTVLSIAQNQPLAIDADHLAAARKAVESNASLSEEVKTKALEYYDQAAKWLQETIVSKEKLSRLETRLKNAPQRIEEINTRLEAPSNGKTATENDFGDTSIDQLEVLLSQETQAYEQEKAALKKQQDELASLLVGAKTLSEDIAASTQIIDQIENDLESPVANESAPLSQAREFALKARRALRSNEVDRLKLRLGSLNLLTNLAQAERDLLEAEITHREPRLEALKQRVQTLREQRASEALQKAETLKTESAELPPAIRTIAQENANYRKELEALVLKEEKVTRQLETTRIALDDIKSDFERTQQRVEVVGLTPAIGKMLVRRREDLPSLQSYRRTSAERSDEINRATDHQIEIDELLRVRGDIQQAASIALNGLASNPLKAATLKEEATRLVKIRRDSLNELQTVYGRYIAQLTTLDLVERRRLELSGDYIEFIDEQLLWIPGHGIADLVSVDSLTQTFSWFFSSDNWRELSEDLGSLLRQRLGSLLILAGLFFLLLKNGFGAAPRIESIARETYKIRTDSFLLTLRVLGLSLAMSGAWPLLMIGMGHLLSGLSTADPFTISIAHGLVKAGWVLFGLHFLRYICLPNGLGDRHLRWSPSVRQAMAQEFTWLLPIAVPLSFIVEAAAGHSTPVAAKIPGQIAFIVMMGFAAIFVYRVLRRRGAMMSAVLAGKEVGAMAQMHFLWFSAAVALPIALAITSALGYHTAALYFSYYAETTFWFFLALFLSRELILRYLYIAERQLKFDDAVRRREELRAQREEHEENEEHDGSPISLEIPEMDYSELGEQATRLVQAGFLFTAVIGAWMIWSELLPALGFLNTTELPFSTSRTVDGVVKVMPLTLSDLVVGIIFLSVTILAAKNIPGILEITLLQRLPLDAGSRYAITALSQYSIAGIGIMMAFSHIGLQWSNIQWLVAALSVGLGFGLQEIVANFISGIILLFERPIRVGDVVTVNNTTGVVSRIRIRATTITKYDKQELLIPNKQFITAEVTNWTLSNKMNRILITVGVGYEADVDRAMALMIEAAEEHPEILDDPIPVASFEAFGDNSLTLMLRSYLGSMDNRLAVITALHRAIKVKLDAAGISIAFPQRDLHLDSKSPLEVRITQDSMPMI